jgi:hypothetical protein
MKIKNRSATCLTRTPLGRALACVLLIGIIYAVTFGSVHSHRNVSSKFETNRAASSMKQAGFSSNVPLHSHSQGHDCLICVLHQQLFNSIVNTPLFIDKPSTQVAFVPTPTVHYHSGPIAFRPIARLSGRAPPLN